MVFLCVFFPLNYFFNNLSIYFTATVIQPLAKLHFPYWGDIIPKIYHSLYFNRYYRLNKKPSFLYDQNEIFKVGFLKAEFKLMTSIQYVWNTTKGYKKIKGFE